MFTPVFCGKQSSSLLHSLPMPAVNVAPLAAFYKDKLFTIQRVIASMVPLSGRIQVRFGYMPGSNRQRIGTGYYQYYTITALQ